MEELQKIKRGWHNVPENLKTKTQLSKMGLKPTGGPTAQIYSYKDWVFLYDINETEPKRKPTEKQLEALEKARQQKEENERLREEERIKAQEERELKRLEALKQYGLNTFGKWFKEDFIILDTETTSLDGEIIEIAIIDKNENVLFDSLIKPKGEISQEAYYIHGINKEMVQSAPTWKEVFPRISEILKNRSILIYNDQFDVAMINNSCYQWGIEPPEMKTECVMRTYADYNDFRRWVSLERASGIYTRHRALGDCINTLKVVRDVWRELGLLQGENEYEGEPFYYG